MFDELPPEPSAAPGAVRPFAELCASSNFTFLVGASHPEEIVARAAELELAAVAIADRNSLAGVVRAHVAARALRRRVEAGPDAEAAGRRKLDASDRVTVTAEAPSLAAAPAWSGRHLVATRLVLEDEPVVWVAAPVDRAAYGRLCRLLTIGKRRASKGACRLLCADLDEFADGLLLLALPPDPFAPEAAALGDAARAAIARRVAARPETVFLVARPAYDGRDAARIAALARLAETTGAPMLASADPLYHHAARRRLADVLTCIRERAVIDGLGVRAAANAERRLRSGAEMTRLFADWPEAVSRTVAVAERCRFSLDMLRYEYPEEVSTDPETGRALDPQARLEALARAGLEARYPRDRHPDGPPPAVRAQCERELTLIGRLGYARYFLTVRDLVDFAESRDILAQGRGSAANSVVCYALRITAIGPEVASMVFERFVSEARGEPPDIDVDFEHERREEVIQHLYARYGRHRAGLCATVIHFRSRAAIREVGRAMGLSPDIVAAIASQIWGWGDDDVTTERLREIGLDPTDARLRETLRLVDALIGFPRHLSQHVGGFVITRDRLDEICPIENAAMADRTVIEWDKDDIDALGILKIDVLSLGMLTCLRKGFDLIAAHGGPRLTLATVPPEDPAVYAMLSTGDSVGVFQVESRAQMNFLPRMRPKEFYDLVIEVAIVRPGPIQGDMVHPYLRRRQGLEAVEYPSGALAEVLGKTLGVPLFQEQAMRIAIVGAGFTPEEADRLRRSLATFRKSGTIHSFRTRFVGGMIERGYEPDFAERCFDQIEGFGEYGFPESHAASFALLVYASAWMKRHHPAAFACALLNAQPMGFYAPAQIVRDARAHGVTVRPVSIRASAYDCTLEREASGALALRLGFRQVKGVGIEDAARLVAARGNGYLDLDDLRRRAGLDRATLLRLAEADAFVDLGLDRRAAIWAARAQGPIGLGATGRSAALRPAPLFDRDLEGEGLREPEALLPTMTLGEAVVEDYHTLRLSLRAHPLALLRGLPALRGPTPNGREPITAATLRDAPARSLRAAVGLVVVRQRPGSAKGVIFLTLEDETGSINVVVWTRVYRRFRRAVIAGRLLRVEGAVQREGEGAHAVVHLVAERIDDLSPLLDRLGRLDLAPPATAADEARRPPGRDPRTGHSRSASEPTSQGSTSQGPMPRRPMPQEPAETPPRPSPRATHPRAQAGRLFPSRDFR